MAKRKNAPPAGTGRIGDGSDDNVVIDDDGSGGPLELSEDNPPVLRITRINFPARGLARGNFHPDATASLATAVVLVNSQVNNPTPIPILRCEVLASGRTIGDPPGGVVIQMDTIDGIPVVTTKVSSDMTAQKGKVYHAPRLGKIQAILLTDTNGIVSVILGGDLFQNASLQVKIGLNYTTKPNT